MSIKQWPESQRPREKLLNQGAEALSDAELLAIFLRTGIPGLDAVSLSQKILNRFGSIASLFQVDLAEFCQGPGLGPAKFVQLQAVLEMSRRYLRTELQSRKALTSPTDTRNFLLAQMQALPREQFSCIWLDSQHRVLRFETLFYGTIDSAAVYPREVVKAALACNAAAVILAHNHPSGVAEPSSADQLITERIRSALDLVDVRLLDHMVVGQGVVISFAERGLI
ncbi:RadC family protein [Reinekea thalattae]|uniref:JAB domain-containing protein n=1 Tax=Reinekea thalattae TaxID=2593301 RepID=A0A5C8ZD40_9GAMM|nr:DNA repair protein RadC [Reinekea thalattae]TXR54826.1 JAB domain-containing protein [Reinekea thalattae]